MAYADDSKPAFGHQYVLNERYLFPRLWNASWHARPDLKHLSPPRHQFIHPPPCDDCNGTSSTSIYYSLCLRCNGTKRILPLRPRPNHFNIGEKVLTESYKAIIKADYGNGTYKIEVDDGAVNSKGLFPLFKTPG